MKTKSWGILIVELNKLVSWSDQGPRLFSTKEQAAKVCFKDERPVPVTIEWNKRDIAH